MSSQLTDEELAALMPSELVPTRTPIPTQIVSSDEFYPDPQNERQREVEARLLAMADDLGGRQGLDRGRNGRFVCCHERGLRAVVRREQGGSRYSGDGPGARERAQGPVHHGHAHA